MRWGRRATGRDPFAALPMRKVQSRERRHPHPHDRRPRPLPLRRVLSRGERHGRPLRGGRGRSRGGSGPNRPERTSPGANPSRSRSTGATPRSRSGSPTASSTPASTPSTATSRPAAATGSPSTSSASPRVTPETSPTPTCTSRFSAPPTPGHVRTAGRDQPRLDGSHGQARRRFLQLCRRSLAEDHRNPG